MNLFVMVLMSAAASIVGISQVPVNICPSQGKSIHVHVHGLRNAAGTVKVVLYGPDPKSFLVKGEKTDAEREPAIEGA